MILISEEFRVVGVVENAEPQTDCDDVDGVGLTT